MIFFSIIVPIYNIEETYLRQCIESTLRQGTDELEVILVNDGSTNNAGEICAEYAEKYREIKFFQQENSGVSAARNLGLKNALGEYIYFLDADDWIPDRFLVRLRSRIAEQTPDIVFFGYRSEYHNRGLTRNLPRECESLLTRENLLNAVLRKKNSFGYYDVGTIWAKVIRRDLLTEKGLWFAEGIKKAQDTLFMLYLYSHAEHYMVLSTVGYSYRKSNMSVMHRFNPEIFEIKERLFAEYKRFFENTGHSDLSDETMDFLRALSLRRDYLNLYFCHKDNPKKTGALSKELNALLSEPDYERALASADGTGRDGILLYFLKKRNLPALRCMVRAEQFVRSLLLKEYK